MQNVFKQPTNNLLFCDKGVLAERIRRQPCNQQIAGSIPVSVTLLLPSARSLTMLSMAEIIEPPQ